MLERKNLTHEDSKAGLAYNLLHFWKQKKKSSKRKLFEGITQPQLV
jgi:hypothetical protein